MERYWIALSSRLAFLSDVEMYNVSRKSSVNTSSPARYESMVFVRTSFEIDEAFVFITVIGMSDESDDDLYFTAMVVFGCLVLARYVTFPSSKMASP